MDNMTKTRSTVRGRLCIVLFTNCILQKIKNSWCVRGGGSNPGYTSARRAQFHQANHDALA